MCTFDQQTYLYRRERGRGLYSRERKGETCVVERERGRDLYSRERKGEKPYYTEKERGRDVQ